MESKSKSLAINESAFFLDNRLSEMYILGAATFPIEVIKYTPHLVHRWPDFGNRANPSMPAKDGTTESAATYTR